MNRRRRNKGPLSPIRLFAIVAIVLLTVVFFVTKTRNGTTDPDSQGEKKSNKGNHTFKKYYWMSAGAKHLFLFLNN